MYNEQTRETTASLAQEDVKRETPTQIVKRKMTFAKAVWIYLLGGLVGTVYETILNLLWGRGFVFCNGSILTPFNFVYGVGAVVIICCLRNFHKWWQVYLIGALGGGAVEYILSFLEETILGTRSWDYSHLFLNLNGRTTLPIMAFWGLLCLAVIFLIYKPLDKALDKVPKKVLNGVAIAFAVLICIDYAVTVLALVRYTGRFAGREALTFLGEWADRVFNDAFMMRHFPAMRL